MADVHVELKNENERDRNIKSHAPSGISTEPKQKKESGRNILLKQFYEV